ncbi:MAG: hypothetical protein ACHQAX_04900 [Gammaproteobacteria bacterium]
MDIQAPFNLVGWVLGQIKHLHELSKKIYPYRLIEMRDEPKSGNTVFKIQLAGKSTVFEMQARDVAGDDVLLHGFSPKDIRIIIYFATKQTLSPLYHVESQAINNETGEMSFDLSDGNQVIRKTASEISLDKNLLRNLNILDAHTIGYQYASEHFFKERDQINLIRAHA